MINRYLLFLGAGLSLWGCAASDRWGETAPRDVSRKSIPTLEGCRFAFAVEFTGKYCGECHTSRGGDPHRDKAVLNLKMDAYRDWLDAAGAVPSVLDKEALEAPIMPPPAYPAQPSDAERALLLEWVKRGSPNTDSGR